MANGLPQWSGGHSGYGSGADAQQAGGSWQDFWQKFPVSVNVSWGNGKGGVEAKAGAGGGAAQGAFDPYKFLKQFAAARQGTSRGAAPQVGPEPFGPPAGGTTAAERRGEPTPKQAAATRRATEEEEDSLEIETTLAQLLSLAAPPSPGPVGMQQFPRSTATPTTGAVPPWQRMPQRPPAVTPY